METIIEVKEVKDFKFKTVDLDSKNSENEYIGLSDCLTEYLKETLDTLKIEYENLKVFYSLGYSQGDGCMFEGYFKYKNVLFDIKQSGYYYHEYSKDIDSISFIVGKNELYPNDLTTNQEKKFNDIVQEFEELYITICKKLEKYGYDYIYSENKYSIIQHGISDFYEENHLFNIPCMEDYKTEQTKGYIKICDSGDTSIKGVWIKKPKVNKKRILSINEIVTYEVI